MGEIMERKSTLMYQSKICEWNKEKKTTLVTLVGVNQGVGVTHTTILLGNYLNQKGAKVALVEWNTKSDYKSLEEAYEGRGFESEKTEHFKIFGMTFYKDFEMSKMPKVMAKGYDYILFDRGARGFTQQDLLFSDFHIVVGHASEWKQSEWTRFCDNNEDLIHNRWIGVVPLADAHSLKDLMKKLPITLYDIPCHEDPFIKNRKLIPVFERFI